MKAHRQRLLNATTSPLVACVALSFISDAAAYAPPTRTTPFRSDRTSTGPSFSLNVGLRPASFAARNALQRSRGGVRPLLSENIDGTDGYDPNRWLSTDDEETGGPDWEDTLTRREEGSAWSAFEPADESNEGSDGRVGASAAVGGDDDVDGGEEAWLDALAGITADEINFMAKEADRADKARQMQEFGFDSDAISSTLGVATDQTLETDPDNSVLEAFNEETAKSGFGMYIDDDVDLAAVESHTKVEWDDETDEPIRSQMVYVDEVTCIGCTNCAMIAQSTFFMDDEHGRARVFEQWGDDEETIAVAIETCPVDCIHYVPYEELKRLELDRRGQNINSKARLVNQGDYRSGVGSTGYGGAAQFTGAQVISGNMGSRCNNCPSAGCNNCPMYGVGQNPGFKEKENRRKERIAKKEMKKKMESENKRAEL